MDAAQDYMNSGKPFVTAVFASWCPHCVKMKGTWAEFSSKCELPVSTFDYDTYRAVISSHKCDVARMLSTSVTSFPHVALVLKDANRIGVHVYDGVYPMTLASLTSFVAKTQKITRKKK